MGATMQTCCAELRGAAVAAARIGLRTVQTVRAPNFLGEWISTFLFGMPATLSLTVCYEEVVQVSENITVCHGCLCVPSVLTMHVLLSE